MNKSCQVFGHKFITMKKREYYTHRCSRDGCTQETDYPKDNKWENTFWTSDEFGFIRFALCFMLFVVGILFLAYICISLTYIPACKEYARMGMETHWNLWTTCMIKHPIYGWIPSDEYFKILNVVVN